MCFSKKDVTLSDNLSRPLNIETVDSFLWSDKFDYIDRSKCSNLNPDNFNLVILQLNIRSVLNKQLELKQLLHDLEKKNLKVDILLLCETFLTSKTAKLVNILDYNHIHND